VHLEGNTILSAKDMKTIQFLDKIVAAGVDSVKVEGRTKPSDYVAEVTRCYRGALDAIMEGSFCAEKVERWNTSLAKVYNRGFSEGFFFKAPDGKDIAAGQGSVQTQKRINAGVVINYYAKIGVAKIRLFDDFKVGDRILIEGETTFLEQKVESMQQHHKEIKKAGKGEMVGIKVIERVRLNDKVFVFKENTLK
jgi:putative protease